MEFSQVSDRAIQLRKKYADLEKERYGREWNNLEIMAGLVADIGDLSRLIMTKEGVRRLENVEERLKNELSDCLWSLLVLANNYGIDLESTFMNTMHQLENRFEKGYYEKQA